jgi:gluconate kinase
MDSQFAELEPPHDEPGVIVLDAAEPLDRLVGDIIERLGLADAAAAPQRPEGR